MRPPACRSRASDTMEELISAKNLGREPAAAQSISMTSPGIVYKDLIIGGGRNPETLPAPPGDVRAFDVRTGQLKWSFHTASLVPANLDTKPGRRTHGKPAEPPTTGRGFALDAKRGNVYVPTGSAAFDFYGADRIGDDLFVCRSSAGAECGDGRKNLAFSRGVRHDLWDRDFPSPPVLCHGEARRKQY